MNIEKGEDIPIEEREAIEITEGLGSRTAPQGVRVYNPAFDVTPAENITALVTEFGVIENPSTRAIRAHFQEAGVL